MLPVSNKTQLSFDELLAIIRSEPDKLKKGTKFEELMVNFFKKDTMYKAYFSNVWWFKDWPKRNRRDTGIDIIGQISDTGEYVGIQCKCYDDHTPLDYAGVSKFLTACKSYGISKRIYVCTSDKITPESERTIRENEITLLNKASLRNSSIANWSSHFDKIVVGEPKALRPDQRKVRDDVINGFKTHRRGKMLMACGTGKTITSLRIAEDLKCKTVLYLVPSISLIQQTMREWSDNSLGKYQYIAVCSDESAGRDEGGQIYELERPPSTDVGSFVKQLSKRHHYDMCVIFSTYQSIDIVASGLDNLGGGGTRPEIDLILCDEAHKTATKIHVNKSKSTEHVGYYGKIHDNKFIASKRRLYMTATPKLYESNDNDVYSMDDENIFGPTFSIISFYDAVHGAEPVLSDFKVKIAILPEDRLPKYLGIVDSLRDPNTPDDVKLEAKLLEHKAKCAAAWHGILKPDDDQLMNKPLQKVIVFTNTIEKSKVFAGVIEKKQHGSFGAIANEYNAHYRIPQSPSIMHIDGTMLSYQRRQGLDWLDQSGKDPDETRIISNAKCLSEGIDVPSLDGVIFMEPKRSTVDVVQSVGRVMRAAPDKECGYVILPVVVPGGSSADEILKNSSFAHVWEVLNALRSHDPRLIAELSSAGLVRNPTSRGGTGTPRIQVDFLGIDPQKEAQLYADLTLAMRSKLVKKVGTVDYVQKYGAKLGAYAKKVNDIINTRYKNNLTAKKILDCFHNEMMTLINSRVTLDDSIKMISQHVILKHVFDALFYDDFATENPVSVKLDSVLKSLNLGNVLAGLGDFYKDVQRETEVINNSPDEGEKHIRRQEFMKRIYESFITSSDKKTSIEKGIVYTPVEIADFVINSVQHLLKTRIKKTLGQQDVQILEPFVGTGTFLTRSIELGLLDRSLPAKYFTSMHANEIVLLAYYIAAVNMETVYARRMKKLGQKVVYSPFPNINYTDTLKQDPREHATSSVALTQYMDDDYVKKLIDKIQCQNLQCVEVILGNPPWGVAPKDKNEGKNKTQIRTRARMSYDVQSRINETYRLKTPIGQKKLHEWYIRALRWSSDRIAKSGIIAFVINGSLVTAPSFAGVRFFLHQEFDEILYVNLRGKKGKDGDGRNIFEYSGVGRGGTTSSVGLLFLVKNPVRNGDTKKHIWYYELDKKYQSGQEKRTFLQKIKSIKSITSWMEIIPNEYGDWIDKSDDTKFLTYTPITSSKKHTGIFRYHKNGVVTSQDEWVYNVSKPHLANNVKKLVNYLNENIHTPNFKETYDPTCGKYTRDTINRLRTHGKQIFDSKKIRPALYRPFFTQHLYFDWIFNAVWNVNDILPDSNVENKIILASWGADSDLSVLMTNLTPDLHVLGSNKCFPMYYYKNGRRLDNIAKLTLEDYQNHYSDLTIGKADIFYYVYGILHHSQYKTMFRNNLKKHLPHIPFAPNFDEFSKIGEQLSDLHLNFSHADTLLPESIVNPITSIKKPITNIKFVDNRAHAESTLAINGDVVYDNLPKVTYTLNGRTPLGWFVDRCRAYQKPYRKSKLTNPIFENMTLDSLTDRIRQLLNVSIKTERYVDKLPSTFLPD